MIVNPAPVKTRKKSLVKDLSNVLNKPQVDVMDIAIQDFWDKIYGREKIKRGKK